MHLRFKLTQNMENVLHMAKILEDLHNLMIQMTWKRNLTSRVEGKVFEAGPYHEN